MTSKGNSLQLRIEGEGNVGSPRDGKHHRINLKPKYPAYRNAGSPRASSDLSWPNVTRRQAPHSEVTSQDQPLIVGKPFRNSRTFVVPRGRWSEPLSDEARTWRKANGGSHRRSLTPYPYQRPPTCSDSRFHRTVSEEWTLEDGSDDISESTTVLANNMTPLCPAMESEKVQPEELAASGDKDEDPVALPEYATPLEKCHKAVQTQTEAWTNFWDLSRLPRSMSLRKVESESSLDQFAVRCRSDYFVKEQQWAMKSESAEHSLRSSREADCDERPTNTSECYTPSDSKRKLCTKHKHNFNGHESEHHVSGTYFVMSVAAIAISAILVAIAMLDIIPMMYNWILDPEEEGSSQFLSWFY